MKDISKKIKPLHDRVVIRELTDDKEKKTSSGIFIPAGAAEDKNGKRGTVVAIGPGRISDNDGKDGAAGKVIPLSVKIDDIVIFQWGDKVTIEGEEYYVVRESEILAIIK